MQHKPCSTLAKIFSHSLKPCASFCSLKASSKKQISQIMTLIEYISAFVSQRLRNLSQVHGLSQAERVGLRQKILPARYSETLAQFEGHCFCGTYSSDGEVFMSACQGAVPLKMSSVPSRVVFRKIGCPQNLWLLGPLPNRRLSAALRHARPGL